MPCVLPAFFIGWFSTSAMEFRVCFTYTDTRDTDVDEPRKNLRGTAPAPQNIHPIDPFLQTDSGLGTDKGPPMDRFPRCGEREYRGGCRWVSPTKLKIPGFLNGDPRYKLMALGQTLCVRSINAVYGPMKSTHWATTSEKPRLYAT